MLNWTEIRASVGFTLERHPMIQDGWVIVMRAIHLERLLRKFVNNVPIGFGFQVEWRGAETVQVLIPATDMEALRASILSEELHTQHNQTRGHAPPAWKQPPRPLPPIPRLPYPVPGLGVGMPADSLQRIGDAMLEEGVGRMVAAKPPADLDNELIAQAHPQELFPVEELHTDTAFVSPDIPPPIREVHAELLTESIAEIRARPVPPSKGGIDFFAKMRSAVATGSPLPPAPPRAIAPGAAMMLTQLTPDEEIAQVELEGGRKPIGEQVQALKTLMTSAAPAIAVTGPAGAGKSTLVDFYCQMRPATRTATTAKAAMNIDGITIDRALHFSRDNYEVRNWGRLGDIMAQTPRDLVIDESSMIGLRMADLIFAVAKAFEKRVILLGDWAQAAPVMDEWAVTSNLFTQGDFIKLRDVRRQANSPYLDVLAGLRLGEVTHLTRELFASRVCPQPPEDDTWTRGFATHKLTDNYNGKRMAMLHAPQAILEATFTDLRDMHMQSKYPRFDSVVVKALDDSPMAHNLTIKVGMRVRITSNEPSTEIPAFVNGDTGTLIDARMSDGKLLSETVWNPWGTGPKPYVLEVVVQLDRSLPGAALTIRPLARDMKDPYGKPDYSVRGFPLAVGYACTLHSVQGLTLHKLWIDMASILHMQGESKHGLAYVALSRTPSIENLLISGWHDDAVYCSPIVKPFIA